MPQPAKPSPDAPGQPLSDEILQSLDANPTTVSKLSKADKYALASRLEAGDPPEIPEPSPEDPQGEPPAETPTPEKPADAAPAEEAKPEGKEKTTSDDEEKPFRKDRKYWKEKSIRDANERNELKMKLDATQRRLRAFEENEAAAKAVKAEKPLDPYDDNEMRSTADKLAKMEKELAGYRDLLKSSAKTEADEIQASLAKKEEVSVFTEISRLQSEFEDLRTEKPFEKLNAEYATWLDRLVELSGFKERMPDTKLPELRSMARELFTEDEDFRREATAKKAKPPKELEKIETILTIHEKKSRDGGNYRANYLDHLAESGSLQDVISRAEQKAALSASNATISAMTRGSKGNEQLTPTDGSSAFPEKAAPEKMMDYIKSLNAKVARGGRMTTEEKATATQYMELLTAAT